MENYDITIKRTFLSFAQKLFEQDPKYTWNIDPTVTEVHIVDKYAINLKVLEKKRSIVLTRGAYSFSMRGTGQHLESSTSFPDIRRYTDTIRGTVTYNCLSQNGLVAEHMAHKLFVSMAGYKEQFRKNGINNILSLSIGEESVLKSDSNIELTTVPVHVQFETQKEFRLGEDFYSIYLDDADDLRYYQNTDFEVTPVGGIEFYDAPPTGYVMTATYVDGITLDSRVETLTGDIDGINKDFTLQHTIYGEYPIGDEYSVTVSGLTTW